MSDLPNSDTGAPEMANTCVMLFARAPVPGQCKTRLIPALGANGAALLHQKLVRRALASACEANPASVELWCEPDTTHAFFSACARDFPIRLFAQSGKDLGERMHNALVHALQHYQRALLIGSDIPGIDAAYLRAAAVALARSPAVFGPAEDGGYVLVGLNTPAQELFRDITWGGPRVMSQTRQRLRSLDWRAEELATLWDLDRPEDLARLRW
ncbi:MAG: TIGR04282 family arsenosugar biosynthesis glycosyltransferase [Burkholderiales bacterium]